MKKDRLGRVAQLAQGIVDELNKSEPQRKRKTKNGDATPANVSGGIVRFGSRQYGIAMPPEGLKLSLEREFGDSISQERFDLTVNHLLKYPVLRKDDNGNLIFQLPKGLYRGRMTYFPKPVLTRLRKR